MRIVADLPGDSWDYEILTLGTQLATAASGAILEIGLRRGGGLGTILNALYEMKDKRTIIAIDPYGDIPYDAADDRREVHIDYTNDMMLDALANAYLACGQHQQHFIFLPFTDRYFMDHFADGVPIYNQEEAFVNEYALVHFDGPHSVESVLDEAKFFHERTSQGAVFVFDDIEDYDHQKVEDFLLDNGWELRGQKGRKILYYKRGMQY